MASRKRRMYCFGEMIVGSLPPARRPVLFTHVSSCLSHVNWQEQQPWSEFSGGRLPWKLAHRAPSYNLAEVSQRKVSQQRLDSHHEKCRAGTAFPLPCL
jgi:hypothetical protein